jgi:hypothetical protein
MTSQPDALVGAIEDVAAFLDRHATNLSPQQPALYPASALRQAARDLRQALATHKAQQDDAPADPVKGGEGERTAALADLEYVAGAKAGYRIGYRDGSRPEGTSVEGEDTLAMLVERRSRPALAALASHTAKPSGEGKCFECGHELHAPFCPACNPEMAAPAETVGIPAGWKRWQCFHCTFASSDEDEAREHFGTANIGLAFCQELERHRADVERVVGDKRKAHVLMLHLNHIAATANASPVAPAPVVDRDEG